MKLRRELYFTVLTLSLWLFNPAINKIELHKDIQFLFTWNEFFENILHKMSLICEVIEKAEKIVYLHEVCPKNLCFEQILFSDKILQDIVLQKFVKSQRDESKMSIFTKLTENLSFEQMVAR